MLVNCVFHACPKGDQTGLNFSIRPARSFHAKNKFFNAVRCQSINRKRAKVIKQWIVQVLNSGINGFLTCQRRQTGNVSQRQCSEIAGFAQFHGRYFAVMGLFRISMATTQMMIISRKLSTRRMTMSMSCLATPACIKVSLSTSDTSSKCIPWMWYLAWALYMSLPV